MAAQLVPSPEVSQADWYGAALAGFGGRVDQVVPGGYPAYARILHPADDEAGRPVRWSEVAASCGTTLHPLADFHAVARRWQYDRRRPVGWPGENPFEGSLAPNQLRVLCDLLAAHTTTPDVCWLAVWEGFGNIPASWHDAPRVQQPHRAYYLFERALAEVFDFSVQIDRVGWDQQPLPESMSRMRAGQAAEDDDLAATQARDTITSIQSPNQWWPQDRAWCVASEIDFDSTLVAGSEVLIGEIIGHADLEAFPVAPADDLSHRGDTVNPRL